MPAERIWIVPYDPVWVTQFTQEAARIRHVLHPLAWRIDHVGSTAVPGLGAKPVIDIQVSVASLQPRAAYDELLGCIGYSHIHVGEFDAVYPFFQKPREWPTTHHVHLCRTGSREELTHLVFRDYLRDHPDAAAEYEALKYTLAAAQVGVSYEDRERYSLAKTPFIAATVERALAEGYGVPPASEDSHPVERAARGGGLRAPNPPMSQPVTISRRLAAVLIADVVGYSRLMERGETVTHTRLQAVRAEVTDPAIKVYGGRIVRTVGDGLLVEFKSATEALHAAVTIQRDMAARNQGVPAEERLEYRIGINLGDIIVTANDIEGDGVNLAARLEALADPGAICVSHAVQEQVHDDLGVAFVDAGEQRVKNIARPVRVYRVVLHPLTGWDTALARWRRWRRHSGVRGTAAGLLVVALALGGGAAWWSQRAFAPPRLSIATVPFATIPEDAQNTQLARALNAELSNGLSRLGSGGLFSVPKSERPDPDPRRVARELNVRYVLTGVLKRDAERLEVQAQLVDGESGASVWSDQFAYSQDASNRADRLAAARLSAALRLELLQLEARRAERKPPSERDATDLAVMAYVVLYGPDYSNRERLKEAGEWLKSALSAEPNNVLALTTRVDWLISQTEYLTPADAAPLKEEARALVKRALAATPGDGEVWSSYATVLEITHEYSSALEAIDRSLLLDPVNVNSMLYRGRLLMMQGRPDDAVLQVRQAAELAPQVQDVVGSAALVECQALYIKREYAGATEACERAHGLGVGGYVTAMLLAVLYVHAGEPAKAQLAKERALKEFPELRLKTFFQDRLDGPIGPRYREWSTELKQLGFTE